MDLHDTLRAITLEALLLRDANDDNDKNEKKGTTTKSHHPDNSSNTTTSSSNLTSSLPDRTSQELPNVAGSIFVSKNNETTTTTATPPPPPHTGRKQLPIVTADLLYSDEIVLTREESVEIYTQICGRLPPEIAIWEERLLSVEDEIWKLPMEEKASFVRLVQNSPMIFTTLSNQAKLFLMDNGYDAKRAAQRIAKYWEQREHIFGKGQVPIPTMEYKMNDFIRFYKRSEQIIENPDTDQFCKQMSIMYIRSVTVCKIKALEEDIKKIIAESKPDLCSWVQEEFTNQRILQQHAGEEGQEERKGKDMDELQIQQAPPQEEEQKETKPKQDNEDVNVVDIGTIICELFTDDEKMLFIRCEDYIETRAAVRIVNYIQMKYNLFGPKVALRKSQPIALDDMKNSWEEVQLGFFRIMPGTDIHGRTVILWDVKKLNDLESSLEDGVVRAVWYIIHSAVYEQKSAQRNGVVFLVDLRGCDMDYVHRGRFRSLLRKTCLECAPVQIKAIHLFIPPIQSWWQKIMFNIFSLTGKRVHIPVLFTTNVMIHAGIATPSATTNANITTNDASSTTHQDAIVDGTLSQETELLDLQNVGLLPSQLPTDLGGDVTFDSYLDWVEERKQQGL